MRGVEASLQGEVLAADRVGKPTAALLPEDLEKAIRGARDRFYAAVNLRTLPYDRKGTRIVPVRALPDVQRTVDDAVRYFDEVADSIVDQYDRIAQFNREYWAPRLLADARGNPLKPGQESLADEAMSERRYRATIGDLMPARDKFRGEFRAYYSFPEPTDEVSRFEEPALREFLERANAEAKKRAEEVARSVVEEPTSRLLGALDELRRRLADRTPGSRLTADSLNGVRASLELLRACGDAISPRLLQQATEFGRRIDLAEAEALEAADYGGTQTATLRSLAPALVEAIDGLAATALDRTDRREMLERFGVAPRRLRIRK